MIKIEHDTQPPQTHKGATPSATKNYVDKHWQVNPKLSPDSWRLLDGLTVSKVGFGCYRLQNPDHASALEKALLSGVNLIDSASNYGLGAAEVGIGQVLKKLFKAGKLSREEVVITSKAGYIQGGDLTALTGAPYKEDGVYHFNEHMAYSLHPDFIDKQLRQSLERLQLETLDIFFAHNPEYILMALEEEGKDINQAREIFYQQLTNAFIRLEELCQEGLIARYGVSSNTFGEAKDHPHAVDLARVCACSDSAAAHVAGRKKRGKLKVIQAPLNLLETGVLFTPSTTAKTFDGEEIVSTLEFAARKKLSVLTNRPLNVSIEGKMGLRLAPLPAVPEKPQNLVSAEEALAESLGGWPNWQDKPMFRLSVEGEVFADQAKGRLHADALIKQLIEPSVAAICQFAYQQNAPQAQVQSYEQAMRTYCAYLIDLAAQAEKPVHDELFKQLPQSSQPLTLQAVGAVASLPGVTCVLWGARDSAYVDDMVEALQTPDFANVENYFLG